MVSRGSWAPAGFTRQPLLSKNPPPGRIPTCSRGAGWDDDNAAMATRMSDAAYNRRRSLFAFETNVSWVEEFFIRKTFGRWGIGGRCRMLSGLLSGLERPFVFVFCAAPIC